MTELPKLHIAVLMGGWANERPVSLMSGEGIAKALAERGHRVTRIDMDRQVAARIAEAAPDVVFNALHGVPGEDGTVQGMLDLMGVPYTHSGLATSVIAIDKQLTKQALVPHGIPMPTSIPPPCWRRAWCWAQGCGLGPARGSGPTRVSLTRPWKKGRRSGRTAPSGSRGSGSRAMRTAR